VTAPFDKETLQLGSKVDDLHDSAARKNFRLVVIVPDVVEQTDLSDPDKGRRFRYTFEANEGWKTEELWP
jgi:pyridoxamine 5'-phosphate oxidase